MPLCDYCGTITAYLFDILKIGTLEDVKKDIPFAVSAVSCTLCAAVVEGLPDASWAEVPLYTGVYPEYSELQADATGRRTVQSLCGFYLLVGRRGRIPNESVWPHVRVSFAIWADSGSLASRHCPTRPPILTPDIQSFCSLAKVWLGECNCFHGYCKCDRGTSTLPTRVLKLTRREHGAAPLIRLIETNGLQAEYTALSHCWGRNLPLMTTRANFAQHKNDIPIVSLPKTFREAIMLALGVGLEYIWIDSLCIIQGDIEDWKNESNNMGAVYRNASFVIAAAASQDSSGGLQPSRAPARTYSISCVIEDTTEGSFNIALMPEGKRSPKADPLGDRAWALQEWYLASRILFCLSSGLAWRCRELEILECGNKANLVRDGTKSWISLLEYYTAMKLTVPTDRLYALRGIVAEMQKTSSDRFLYDLGIWDVEDYEDLWADDIIKLAKQLLWRRKKRDDDTASLPLPTWCWAATGWGKRWIWSYRPEVEMFHVPEKLEVQSSSALKCVGSLVDVKIASRRVSEHFYDGLYELHKVMHINIYPNAGGSYEGYPAYRIQDRSLNTENLGIVIFDGEYEDNVRCFPLLAVGRCPGRRWFAKSRAQLCRPNDDELNISFAETSLSKPRLRSDQPSDRVEIDFSIDFSSDRHISMMEEVQFLEETIEYVYFGLVLRPTIEGKFERAGVAFLYPCALDQGRSQHVEFEIV
ncbi:HET-domain-containing protein [Pyrenochaeta sp. DS3sAY3a]|nr:HET-domain-containing protein [Pyrenochaeta sp. DS3sAY3a]